jgi:hypothetical protein
MAKGYTSGYPGASKFLACFVPFETPHDRNRAVLTRYREGRLKLVVMRAIWIVLHYGPKARV